MITIVDALAFLADIAESDKNPSIPECSDISNFPLPGNWKNVSVYCTTEYVKEVFERANNAYKLQVACDQRICQSILVVFGKQHQQIQQLMERLKLLEEKLAVMPSEDKDTNLSKPTSHKEVQTEKCDSNQQQLPAYEPDKGRIGGFKKVQQCGIMRETIECYPTLSGPRFACGKWQPQPLSGEPSTDTHSPIVPSRAATLVPRQWSNRKNLARTENYYHHKATFTAVVNKERGSDMSEKNFDPQVAEDVWPRLEDSVKRNHR